MDPSPEYEELEERERVNRVKPRSKPVLRKFFVMDDCKNGKEWSYRHKKGRARSRFQLLILAQRANPRCALDETPSVLSLGKKRAEEAWPPKGRPWEVHT